MLCQSTKNGRWSREEASSLHAPPSLPHQLVPYSGARPWFARALDSRVTQCGPNVRIHFIKWGKNLVPICIAYPSSGGGGADMVANIAKDAPTSNKPIV